MPSPPPDAAERRNKHFRVLILGLILANGGAWAVREATARDVVPASPRGRTPAMGSPATVAADLATERHLEVAAAADLDDPRSGGSWVLPAPGRAGALIVVPGSSAGPAAEDRLRFLVEVEEGGLRVDPQAFARAVERALFHRRGWSGMDFSFQRVDRPPVDFRVALASPETTDRLCAPLETAGRYSCFMAGRAVLNFERWTQGAATYGDDLIRYRRYMLSHEVGHALGYGHAACGGLGEPAPVMMQQTIGLGGCRPNPWPMAEPTA